MFADPWSSMTLGLLIEYSSLYSPLILTHHVNLSFTVTYLKKPFLTLKTRLCLNQIAPQSFTALVLVVILCFFAMLSVLCLSLDSRSSDVYSLHLAWSLAWSKPSTNVCGKNEENGPQFKSWKCTAH